MKTPVKLNFSANALSRTKIFWIVASIFVYFSLNSFRDISSLHIQRVFSNTSDSSISGILKSQLDGQNKEVYYPQSVERFYRQNGYKLVWIAPDTVKSRASEAMLMLDCVLQVGLNYADYHPKFLTYEKLNILTQKFSKRSNVEKAGFDMMLTDAMITYMNNLHYGKLNPDYPASKIDSGNIKGFDAGTILTRALQQKDFMSAVLSVQPQSRAYRDLQYHLRLLTGLYTGDCYEIPDSTIRKLTINLERLRWTEGGDQIFIDINIPSYTLTFHQPDTAYQFKVVVGRPDAPTPTLQSAISYFTTAPEWKVPQSIFRKEILPKAIKDTAYLEKNHFAIYDEQGNYIDANKATLLAIKLNPAGYYARQSSGCDNSLGLIVFRFPNIYDIYLHDTPERQLFKKEERAYSHGCIRAEQAEKLAGLLLKNDGAASKIPAMQKAIAAQQNKTFTLKKAVPFKITYLTCKVSEGILTIYPDIYNLDEQLEMALYNMDQPLTMR